MDNDIEDEEDNSPSGLRVKCLITGKMGYLGAALLKDKVEEFGSLEEVGKHYICRAAGKFLRQGLSQEDTRINLGLSNDGYVPVSEILIENSLGTTRKKKRNGTSETNPNEPDKDGVYWWQRSDFAIKADWNRTPMNIEEATKDACLRPDIYLDDLCESCSYFPRCTLPIKKIKGKIPKIEKV